MLNWCLHNSRGLLTSGGRALNSLNVLVTAQINYTISVKAQVYVTWKCYQVFNYLKYSMDVVSYATVSFTCGGLAYLDGGDTWQGAHGQGKTGKTGKIAKKIPAGKSQGIWKFYLISGKTQGIWKSVKYQGKHREFHLPRINFIENVVDRA